MRLLTNPLFLRLLLAFIVSASALVIGILLIRRLRRLSPQQAQQEMRSEGGNLELATYHAVIRRLKDQEQELKQLRDAESRRAARSENISEAVLSNLASGVVLFDTMGIVRQVNAAAKDILGYASPFGLHGRDLFRTVSSVRKEAAETMDSPSALVEALEQTLRQGLTFRRMEVDYTTPSGVPRILGVTLSPVRAAGGEALGAACLVSDLTEIAKLSRQVRLKEHLVALGEMSAGIAHEFKNSLATISGYAQMLNSENEPATVHEFAAKIASETSALTRIVTDFLKLARPLELEREPVAIAAILDDCARECGVDLRSSVPSGLCVRGDYTALRQVFANLLRNSAEASRNGSRTAVAVRAEEGPREVRLVLRDNGCGIPPEQLSKVFIPFFTTKSQGTGLGLALTHRIVSEHGGTISVTSDASGTAFTLSFPKAEQAKEAVERR